MNRLTHRANFLSAIAWQPALIILCAILMSGTSVFAQNSDRPNIVLIIADDMNWDDCGVYGNPSIRTPHIDQLANQGVRFQQAYLTCSSCSPSRASIITGRYPHNTGAEQLHWPLPDGSKTFVGALHDAGYYTAAAGKWHMGEAVKPDFDRIYEASTAGFVLPTNEDGNAGAMVATQPSGCEDWERALTECPENQPFFLWLAALDPHREYVDGALDPPHRASEVVVPKHLPDHPDVREDLRLYYDEIGRLDEYVGRVLHQLEERELASSTLVMFISDNGRPFPRDKTTLYDGGIRTPLIARWPDRIPAAAVSPSLVSTVDIAPTLLDVAGLELLEQFEGASFRGSLLQPALPHRQFAFAEDHWHDYEDHARAVISQHFKLIRNDYPDLPNTPPADAGRSPTWQRMLQMHERGELGPLERGCFQASRPEWELFDLAKDPGEFYNLADDPAYTSVLSAMKSALGEWSRKTDDYLPSIRTPDEFDRVTGQPDHSVRVRPRRSKLEMFGANGKY